LELQQIEINQTNRSLQNLLEEKERLLREIHHRVKNNLQIVMSLLNTQSEYLENDAALVAIRESQHRIHSISLIHQKLYQSENVPSPIRAPS
jgi:two-component sensor histidine kinase